MEPTSHRTVQVPPPTPPRRRLWLAAGAGVLLLAAAGTTGAVLLGVNAASTLQDDTVSRSVTGVRELVVDIDEGRLALRAASGPDVELRTTRTWAPGYEPVVEQQFVGGVLTVRSDCPSFNLGCEVEQEIAVPAGTVVRARTVDGGIEAVELDVPRFSANSVAGAVTASFVRPPEEIRVETVAGGVRVNVPQGAFRVSTDTTAGAVRVGVVTDPMAERSIVVDTVAGPIDISPR